MATSYSMISNAGVVVVKDSHFTMKNTVKNNDDAIWHKLLLDNTASKALHDANNTGFDLPKCYPGTREAIQRDLSKWVQDMNLWKQPIYWLHPLAGSGKKQPIYWLYAPAGSGKTAIAKTLADSFSNLAPSPCNQLLLASFFFRRSSLHQVNEARFIATIAYQIKTNLPQTASFIINAIRADPIILQRELNIQVEKLILEPLSRACETVTAEERATWPRLIVIDGLDECAGQDAQLKVLDVLSRLGGFSSFPLAIFISCRPEPHIRTAFQAEYLNGQSRKTCLPDEYHSDPDIRKFLLGKFREVVNAHRHIIKFPSDWPGETVIQQLIQKSSGQFIYASVVMRYINKPDENPMERLNIVLGLEKNPDDEDPFAELDAFYSYILDSIKKRHRSTVIRVLMVAVAQFHGNSFNDDYSYQNHLHRIDIDLESFLHLNPGQIQYGLANLDEILIRFGDISPLSVTFLHASFSDFLLDKVRSGQDYIDLGLAHAEFAVSLLRYIFDPSISLIKYGRIKSALLTSFCHLTSATPTEELCQVLHSVEIPTSARIIIRKCTTFTGDVWDECGWALLADFATALGTSSLEDASNLKINFLNLVKIYISEELEKYKKEPLNRLIALLSVGGIFPSHIQHGSSLSLKFDLAKFGITSQDQMIDQTSLNLCPTLNTEKPKAVIDQVHFLRECIGDLGYTIHPEVYVSTCVCALKYIRAVNRGNISSELDRLSKVPSSDIGPWLSPVRDYYVVMESSQEVDVLWKILHRVVVPLMKQAGPSVELERWLKRLRSTISSICHPEDVLGGGIEVRKAFNAYMQHDQAHFIFEIPIVV